MRGLLLALAGQILLSAAPLLAQPQPSTGQLLPGLIQAKPPLQVFQPRQPDNKFDPAFPVTIEAPMLIRCPTGVTVRPFDGASPEPLSRIQARINSAISLVCTYGYVGQLTVGGFGSDNACPAEVLAGVVGGPDLGKTTSTGDGCNMGNAWCHGPALGFKATNPTTPVAQGGQCIYKEGTVELGFSPNNLTWITGATTVSAAYSPSGAFLCW